VLPGIASLTIGSPSGVTTRAFTTCAQSGRWSREYRRLMYEAFVAIAVSPRKRRVSLPPQLRVGTLQFGDHVVLCRNHGPPPAGKAHYALVASAFGRYPPFAGSPTLFGG
jgi:hypothetical protein